MNLKNFNISKDIQKKIPKMTLKELQKHLYLKKGGRCFLCDELLDQENDVIVADHDIPENENGKTDLDNLNAVHSECNSFKQDNPAVQVKPYLQLKRKIEKQNQGIQFDGVIKAFQRTTRKVKLIEEASEVKLDTGSGSAGYTVFKEKNKKGVFKFIYADIPIDCLINDKKCQPRNIHLPHLWSIYKDIQKNPLHEAPTCRLDPNEESGSKSLLIFDGQHKAVAFLLDGREKICTKIYLDLDENSANYLVGSIQSKIKKLPLSPFEFTRKMKKEFSEKWDKYSEEAHDPKSEKLFLQSIPAHDRGRTKQAFIEAYCANIIDDEDLLIRRHIKNKRNKNDGPFTISEQTFKKKILLSLLRKEPLENDLSKLSEMRENEKRNIIKLLNLFYKECLAPKNDPLKTDTEKQKAKMFSYQGALAYVAFLLKSLVGHVFTVSDGQALLLSLKDPNKWKKVADGIKHLGSHPFWVLNRDYNQKIANVHIALEKNQSVSDRFEGINLELGYIITGKLNKNWDSNN